MCCVQKFRKKAIDFAQDAYKRCDDDEFMERIGFVLRKWTQK